MNRLIVGLLIIILITECAGKNESTQEEDDMNRIYSIELNSIEPEHVDKVSTWLDKSRIEAKEKQYLLYSVKDDSSEYSYEYVYGKGFTDYEVTLIHSKSQSNQQGSIHVTGLSWNDTGDSFVKIKYRDKSIDMISLSDVPIAEKLK